MPVLLDASALHPSTRLALMALDWLEDRIAPQKILDIGCGNGILTLASAQLWDTPILACDISPGAVADAGANVREYAPGADITILRSDGFRHPAIKAGAPYGLILANLLAQWQVQMATDIAQCLHPEGILLLSGMLLWQTDGTLAAFASINIAPIQQLGEGEWQCALLRHKAASPLS